MDDNAAFLLSDTARLLRRRFDERARAIGVTRPQWRVLGKLSRREGLTQGALAELLEIEPITLCRMVDRLAEAGLVERRRAPADRRAWNLYLTERARPLIERLHGVGDRLVADMLDGLDEPARAALAAALSRIHHNLSVSQEEAAHG